MKAISLHQPWASLCVTRQPQPPIDRSLLGASIVLTKQPVVKRCETRSWPCPPALIGSRIAIHAAVRKPTPQRGPMFVGDYHIAQGGTWLHGPGVDARLPLGAVVGSATIEACYPIVRPSFKPDTQGVTRIMWDGADLLLRYVLDPLDGAVDPVDISDQLPYGDFTPGRYAWLLTAAAPTTQRCPWCDGLGGDESTGTPHGPDLPCPICRGAGRCDPVPARGRQRIWNWTPRPMKELTE